jgi:hypothetical protein
MHQTETYQVCRTAAKDDAVEQLIKTEHPDLETEGMR